MGVYQPYTYLIGWTKQNTYYYGVRYAKNASPRDLWNTYFTSSKYVKAFRKKHGEPDLVKIKKVFVSAETARLWESKVLRRMNVIKSDIWLNKTNNISIAPECCSRPCTEEKKEKSRRWKQGRKDSQETRNKKRQAMLGKNVGRKDTEEQKHRKSQAHKGKTYKEKFGERWLEEIEKRRKRKKHLIL